MCGSASDKGVTPPCNLTRDTIELMKEISYQIVLQIMQAVSIRSNRLTQQNKLNNGAPDKKLLIEA
jgi:hypothetical protein